MDALTQQPQRMRMGSAWILCAISAGSLAGGASLSLGIRAAIGLTSFASFLFAIGRAVPLVQRYPGTEGSEDLTGRGLRGLAAPVVVAVALFLVGGPIFVHGVVARTAAERREAAQDDLRGVCALGALLLCGGGVINLVRVRLEGLEGTEADVNA